jgi:hypothetical protein
MKGVIIVLAILLFLVVSWIVFMIVKIVLVDDSETITGLEIDEILMTAEKEGYLFCNKVESKYRDECMENTIINEAEAQKNPELCKKLRGANADECIRTIVFRIVGIGNLENEDHTHLCKLLKNSEDRELCETSKSPSIYCGGVYCHV